MPEIDNSKCVEYDGYIDALRYIIDTVNLYSKEIRIVDPTHTLMVRYPNRGFPINCGISLKDMHKLLEIGATLCPSIDGTFVRATYDNMEFDFACMNIEPIDYPKMSLSFEPYVTNFPVKWLRLLFGDGIDWSGIHYNIKTGLNILLTNTDAVVRKGKSEHERIQIPDKYLKDHGIEMTDNILFCAGSDYFKTAYNILRTIGETSVSLYFEQNKEPDKSVLLIKGATVEIYIAPRIVEDFNLNDYVVITKPIPKVTTAKTRKPRKRTSRKKHVEIIEEAIPTREEVLTYLHSLTGTPDEILKLLPLTYKQVLDEMINDNIQSILSEVDYPLYYHNKEITNHSQLYTLLLSAYISESNISQLISDIVHDTLNHATKDIKEKEPPQAELPREVTYFITYNDLEVSGTIVPMTGIEGYDKDKTVYTIPVIDTATHNKYTIYLPLPSNMTKYKLIKILNKKGKPVNVVIRKEELSKEPKVRTTETLSHSVTKKELKRVPSMVELTYDRKYIKSVLNKIDNWLGTVQSAISQKNKVQVYTYLFDVREFIDELLKISKDHTLPQMGKEKVMDFKDPIIKDMWQYFCKLLETYGLECEDYRDRFIRMIDPEADHDTIMYTVENLVEDIHMEKENSSVGMLSVEDIDLTTDTTNKKIGFNLIGAGVSNMRVKVNMAFGAVNDNNLIDLITLLNDARMTADKLILYMEQDPEIKNFKKLRGKGLE